MRNILILVSMYHLQIYANPFFFEPQHKIIIVHNSQNHRNTNKSYCDHLAIKPLIINILNVFQYFICRSCLFSATSEVHYIPMCIVLFIHKYVQILLFY